MRWLILLPILVVALLLVTFGVQNTQLVNVRFLSFPPRLHALGVYSTLSFGSSFSWIHFFFSLLVL